MATTRASADAADRRPELDAIRALVVIGLVFFHSALVFDARDDFYVKNPQTSELPTILAGFGVIWAMPMLFLVAGISAGYSLRRRGPGRFARERLRRLGVPLVAATVLLAPLPQWLRQRADPAYDESYPQFLPRFFDVRLEPAEFPFLLQGEHFETGHLWFVVLLLAFSLPLALAVRWVPAAGAARAGEWVARVVGRWRGAVLLPALAVAAVSALLGLEEQYAAWSRWAYLLFFLGGWAIAVDGRLRAAVRRDAVVAGVAGVAMLAVGMPLFLVVGIEETFQEFSPLAMVARSLYGATGWCLLVALAGLLDRPGRATAGTSTAEPVPTSTSETVRTPTTQPAAPRPGGRWRRVSGYLAPAVLPLYILHQPVVVVVAYGVVGWHAPMLVKYAVVVVASLGLTLAGYDLLVRRTPVTRFLFGMRRADRPAADRLTAARPGEEAAPAPRSAGDRHRRRRS